MANSSDNSAILTLPYIQPSQAQKHVTHNAALAILDVLVQLSVTGFDVTTPPVDPVEGETHALGSSPTDAWAGQDNTLATRQDGLWVFITPQAGWRAYGVSEAELRIWDGTNWSLPVAKQDNLDGLGINTTHDITNRLAVSADATLLTHAGNDHQLKVNKATTTDTASLLFQSGFTGHAEMGLSGNLNFAIKVSDDGINWSEALRFDPASGQASGRAVQSSSVDATTGRLLTVGAFGLGSTGASAFTDANVELTSGTYSINDVTAGTYNLPATFANGPASLLVIAGINANNITQLAFAQNSFGTYVRQYRASTFSDWVLLYDQSTILVP
jgi:hypothetical protein